MYEDFDQMLCEDQEMVWRAAALLQSGIEDLNHKQRRSRRRDVVRRAHHTLLKGDDDALCAWIANHTLTEARVTAICKLTRREDSPVPYTAGLKGRNGGMFTETTYPDLRAVTMEKTIESSERGFTRSRIEIGKAIINREPERADAVVACIARSHEFAESELATTRKYTEAEYNEALDFVERAVTDRDHWRDRALALEAAGDALKLLQKKVYHGNN